MSRRHIIYAKIYLQSFNFEDASVRLLERPDDLSTRRTKLGGFSWNSGLVRVGGNAGRKCTGSLVALPLTTVRCNKYVTLLPSLDQ